MTYPSEITQRDVFDGCRPVYQLSWSVHFCRVRGDWNLWCASENIIKGKVILSCVWWQPLTFTTLYWFLLLYLLSRDVVSKLVWFEGSYRLSSRNVDLFNLSSEYRLPSSMHELACKYLLVFKRVCRPCTENATCGLAEVLLKCAVILGQLN